MGRPTRRLHRNDNVAETPETVWVATVAARSGPTMKREGQDVGGSIFVTGPAVERANALVRDEHDVDVRVGRKPE